MTRFYQLFLILIFSFSFVCSLQAQNEGNIWYFGKNAGLDFNSPTVQALTDGQYNGHGGSSVMSDSNGDLMFYSNGYYIWNKNHQIMPNSYVLLGHPSATQNSVIIPKPGSSNIYYVFTNDAYTSSNGLHYSEVDMTLQGGLGDVTAVKNVPLVSQTAEKLTATMHANETDYWVISHGKGDDSFYAFLVSASGVGTAVISNVGIQHINGDPNSDESVGQMKASPNGAKIALATSAGGNTFELFDFNNTTGVVSNPITMSSSNYSNPYGVEFSADGTKLYGSTTNNNKVYQFNLQAGSPAGIMSSATLAIESASTDIGGLQLGPDSRIYLARYLNDYLGIIGSPNSNVSLINYVDDGVYLDGKLSRRGLPNFIQSYFNNPRFTFENLCFGDSTYFYISDLNSVVSVLWNFDDPGSGVDNTSTSTTPFHIFSQTGDFSVQLIRFFSTYSDTVTQQVNIHALPNVNLGSSIISVCEGADTLLFAGPGFESYLWQNGSVTPTLLVSNPGNYSVTVTDDFGCENSDDVTIETLYSPTVDLGNDTTICEENSLTLNAYFDQSEYEWNTQEITYSIEINQADTFWVIVSNKCGDAVDSLILEIYPTISFTLGEDIQICSGDTTVLDPGDVGYDYLWDNGSTTQSIEVSTSGVYYLDIFHAGTTCDVASDTIEVTVLDLPVLNVSNDTAVCAGQVGSFFASGEYITDYIWSTGDNTPNISIGTAGVYYVSASNICATVSDSVMLNVFQLPTAQTINDTAIFTGDSVQLWANSNLLWDYLWTPDFMLDDNMAPDPFAFPETTTTYTILITDTNSCVNSYSVTVSVSDKPLPELTFYNTFSPNGDGVNDYYIIDNIEEYENSLLEVYNRNGQKVLSARNYQNDWNGKYNDNDVPAHTYYFILDPGAEGAEIVKGHITIIR